MKKNHGWDAVHMPSRCEAPSQIREGRRKRIFKMRLDMVAHTANPNIREVVVGRSMSSRTAGAREKLLGLGKKGITVTRTGQTL